MKPEQLGPYRIETEIGSGGMGIVYRAHHVETNEAVAVKVLAAELGREPGFVDRFAREIATISKLNHPGIVRYIESGQDHGFSYYVMEFIEGTSLDKVIAAERRIDWPRAVEWSIQVCRALKHAHDHGVIHRDLKPANLICTPDGRIKLTDFGIAKVFAGTQLTATGGIIGTAEFMSPEQGEGKPITRRSDLYSLGVVLYAMLTGRPPFIGRSMPELLRLHRYGRFDRPMDLVPEIPSWLDALVGELLEKEPEKRPPDAHVVARRLESIQKKAAIRSGTTIAENAETELAETAPGRPARGIGPATLMQRLMRAQLAEIDRPNWFERLFQRTWVLVLGLLVSAAALTFFSLSGGEKRRWKAIAHLAAAADERDLGTLQVMLKEYLRRYPDGAHADEASAMLPRVEQDRERRLFARSAIVNDFRPPLDPPSEVERLYRKSLLQFWTEGPAAAQATLEQIVGRKDEAGRDRFLVDLAEEDLLSLDLERADRLRSEGDAAGARAILRHVLDAYGASRRHASWVQRAQQALEQLDRDAPGLPEKE